MWLYDYLTSLLTNDSPTPAAKARPSTTKLTRAVPLHPALEQLLHPDPNAPRTTRLTQMLTVDNSPFTKNVLEKIYRLMEIKVQRGLPVAGNCPSVGEIEAIMRDACTKEGNFDDEQFEAMKLRLKKPQEAVFETVDLLDDFCQPFTYTDGKPMTIQRPVVDPATGKTKVIDHCENVIISTTLDVSRIDVKAIGFKAASTMRKHYNKDILAKIDRDCEAYKKELEAENHEGDYQPSTPGM